ncbi:MAG: DUF333 domain-containing protein [Candidatus Taylorbacteria bacterium]
MKKSLPIIFALVLLLCGILYLTYGPKKDVAESPQFPQIANMSSSTGLANPASVNCTKQGGTLTIQKNGNGDEYGLCSFDDNRACEEWALLRGECPVGGRKTTGYDTIDQNYCAWLGGETYAVADSICTLKNGTKCKTIDLYNGKCSTN